MAIVVQKLDGTAVDGTDKIRRAAHLAIKAVKGGNQVVVVASASGPQIHRMIDDARELNPSPPKREMDQLLSTGEQQMVSLLAIALEGMGQPAISFTGGQIRMMTDGVFSKARIKSVDSERIRKELNAGRVVTVAGFQGIDDEGNVTTLGGGGSDTSAVALAAALKAAKCVIYTDVDGIYTADPEILGDAVKLPKVSFDEMLELVGLGAGVMHIRALGFGKKYNVDIEVRHMDKDMDGTIITNEIPPMEGVSVTGATIQKEMARITLVGVNSKPGAAAKVFSHLAKAKIVVHDIIQTEFNKDKANLSFMVGHADLDRAKEAMAQIKDELGIDDIFVRDDVALVSAVGLGMRTHYGVAERMFGALAKAEVNIDSITTSEIRISCAVNMKQAQKALIAVCKAFELHKPAELRKQL